MKGGWKFEPLGKVAALVGGGTPSKQTAAFWRGSIPWVSPKDMKHDLVLDSEDHISPAAIEGSATKLIPAGAILIVVRSGILARTIPTAIAGRELTINQDLKAIVPSSKLDSRFLAYFLRASESYLLGKVTRGATVHKLDTDNITSLPVPLPPLEEQRRIVAILDEAFEGLSRARANAEANLQSARELFERVKDQAFVNWSSDVEPVTLAEVSEISASLVDPREFPYCDMPHVGAGNMVTGSDELVGVMTAKEEGLKSGKYTFDELAVLYSKIRPYLRKVARPDFSGLCSADVYPLVPNPKRLDRNFLFHLLLSDQFTSYAEAGSARAGMPKVNREHLFAYSFGLPSLEAQRRIAVAVDESQRECSRLVHDYDQKLQDVLDLRQSLLQKAFAGELTTRELV